MSRTIPAGVRGSELRRELGPVAWCVLECLIGGSDDGRTATASVRAVAEELGVAKNTAHRALAALVRRGLVEAIQSRDGHGRFQPGRYRLHVGDLLSGAATARSRSRSTATTPAVDPAQLSLLPPA